MVTILHYVMVYAGSILMAFNIYRYLQFSRRLRSRGGWEQENRFLSVPIILLVMFLAGYLGVAVFGNPDLMVAAILFGGSIFVFLMIVFVQRVADRIQEHERLAGDLKAAEESNRAKTRFLSTMSHEIRTPLNAIIGLNAIIMKDPDLSAGTREKSEKIAVSADHLLTLISDVLDMNRIEAGQMELNENDFSVNEMIVQVSDIIGNQCASKGLEYICSIDPSVEKCYFGDDVKLKQVLINVLGNSVKFTDAPGYVKFKMEQISSFGDRRTVRFIMSDTGIGMDKEFLPKLFSAFSQEDGSNTNKFGGSGLGMAITKNIVEKMNGDIHVESEKGRGTTFTVTVTLSACKSCCNGDDDSALRSEKGQPDEAKAEAVAVDVELAGMRVLMAEDVELNAEILADLLDLEDIMSERAENGQVAVDMFAGSEAGYYDAVLMDVRMPVLDGLGAAKAIRALDHPDAKTVPIIALTANAFEEDVERSLQAGMDAHLAKPIDPDLLCDTLRKLVAKRRA